MILKKPLIVGSAGNMGRRYGAILRYLNVDFHGVDVGDEWPGDDFDSLIIATPTIDHVPRVRRLASMGVPILCEKPLSTSLKEVLELCRDMEKEKVKLRMVNQYEYLIRHPGSNGGTRYDYWNHGKDGLAWDCINIIGLAKGKATLSEHLPFWTCVINGEVLSLSDVDKAYVKMIQSWLMGDQENIAYIRKAHLKVEEYLTCNARS